MKIDIQQREAQARNLFKQGYNCAQSVAVTYADIVNVDAELINRIALPFGGGFGRLREMCGTVSGAGIIIGAITKPNPNPHNSKSDAYVKVQSFTEKFKQENGSIICRELLAMVANIDSNPEPEKRTTEYYKRRPCVEYIAASVRIIGTMINNDEL